MDGIGPLIEADVEPCEALADARADGGVVLADAGREDETVKAAQR